MSQTTDPTIPAPANQIVADLELTPDGSIAVQDGTLTIGGPTGGSISGTANLKKVGEATLILTRSNTYAGLTEVREGVLEIRHASALGTTTQGTRIKGGAVLQMVGGIAVTDEPLRFDFATEPGIQALPELRSVSGINQFNGPVTIFNSAGAAIRVDAGTLNINRVIANDPDFAGGLTKTGSGTLELAGTSANTYVGTTRVSAGTLRLNKTPGVAAILGELIVEAASGTAQVILSNSNQIADSATVRVHENGKLDLNGLFNETIGPLFLRGGTITTGIGTLTLTSDVNTDFSAVSASISGKLSLGSADRTFNVLAGSAADDLVISAAISSPGAPTVTKTGGGRLVFSGNNTYAGTTTVTGGQLNVRHASGLGTTTAGTTVLAGAALELEGGISVGQEALTLHGSGVNSNGALRSATGNNTYAGTITLNSSTVSIGAAGIGEFRLTGSITNGTGNNGLTKVGTGVLILAGTNNYTGPTVVSQGVLAFTGTSPGSSVTVQSGGILEGTGTLGPATINAGGRLRPGVGSFTPGTLTASGNFVLNADSFFEVDLNGTTAGTGHDRLNVNGTVNVSGSFLSVDLNFQSGVGNGYTVLVNDGSDDITGRFKGPGGVTLQEGDSFLIAPEGPRFRINCESGTGTNDVRLTHVNTSSMFPNRSVTPVIDEGGIAVLTGTISDPDPLDTFFLDVNWGGGTPVQTYTFPPGSPRQVRIPHRYPDDNPTATPEDVYAIQPAWRDDHGEGNSSTLTTTVRNVAPVVNAGGPTLAGPAGVFARVGSFFDPGGADTWTATVDCGDGTGVQALPLLPSNRFVLHHRYAQPGTYSATVTVSDDDGGIGASSFQVLVPPRPGPDLIDAVFALLEDEDRRP